MKKVGIIYCFVVFLFYLLSCDSMLDEDTYGYTEVPLINRVNGTYVLLKDWYGKEMGYDFSEAGTDLFTWGQEHDLKEMMTYEPDYDAENPRVCILWSDLYKAVESCNSAIFHLHVGDPKVNKYDLLKWEAEVRFLRAHYFWLIVETWDSVHFTTNSAKKSEYEANSTPRSVFHKQIINDLNFAVNTLNIEDNTEDAEWGRITKLAALAFRARMHLAQGNYEKALSDADSAIFISESGFGMSLSDDFSEMWKVENTEATNDKNKEVIWTLNYSYTIFSTMNIQYLNVLEYCNTNTGIYSTESYNGDENETNGGGGFWGHLYFNMAYDEIPGMKRQTYNRPYRRYIPTRYFVDIFSENDQRYQATFRFAFLANNPMDRKIPQWPAYELGSDGVEYIPEGAKAGDNIYNASEIPYKGDTAIFLTNKKVDTTLLVEKNGVRIHKQGHYIVLDRNMLYEKDGTPVTTKTKINSVNLNRQIYLGLKKFEDPNIPSGRDVEGSTRSGRDVPIIRLAEMYLIASEASYKSNSPGDMGDALAYITALYNKRSVDNNASVLLNDYEIVSVDDLSNEFFLKERARELAAEQLRWFDLRRMDRNDPDFDMVTWIQERNPDATLMKDYHKRRPIPQMQINAMANPDLYYKMNEDYASGGN